MDDPNRLSIDQLNTLFSGIPYLSTLTDDALAEVVRFSTRREFQPGQVVLMEGETSHQLIVVESGWLKAVKISSEGREQVLHIIESGEVLNTLGVFADVSYPGSVVTLEPSILWFIDQETMFALVNAHPGMAQGIITDLARRVHQLITLVEDLSLHPVETRLARLLIDNAVDDVLERRRWATQAEIASRLGTVTDVVNRALRGFVEEGIIEVTRSEIRVIDMARLQEKAQH